MCKIGFNSSSIDVSHLPSDRKQHHIGRNDLWSEVDRPRSEIHVQNLLAGKIPRRATGGKGTVHRRHRQPAGAGVCDTITLS